MKLNVDAHLFCLGTYAERYVPGGYFREYELKEQLEILSGVDSITGINIAYPAAPLPDDPVKCAELLRDYGLRPSYVLAANWLDPKYKHGAFSSDFQSSIFYSRKLCREAIDYAKAAGAESVLLWPAHDGFDYPFQVNYYDAWQTLVDTVRHLAEYADGFKLAIEPKPKDPRQRMLVSGTGTLLHMINEVGFPNVGGALDVGHSIAAQENMAQALTLLDRADKLYQIHLNDNYRDADPDLIVGSINFFETLEMFYYLIQTGYEGWCSIDIISARDDRAKALDLSARMIQRYYGMARKLFENGEIVKKNLGDYAFTENMDYIYERLFSV